jgi:hypothetical protein
MASVADDFSGDLSNWTQDYGTYATNTSRLYGGIGISNYGRLRYTASSLASDNYEIQATVLSNDGASGLGVAARCGTGTNATCYAAIGFINAGWYLIRLSGTLGGPPTETVLDGPDGTFNPATAYTLRFVVSGSNLSLYINGSGTPTCTATDTNFTTGGVGIVTYYVLRDGYEYIDTWSAQDLTTALDVFGGTVLVQTPF